MTNNNIVRQRIEKKVKLKLSIVTGKLTTYNKYHEQNPKNENAEGKFNLSRPACLDAYGNDYQQVYVDSVTTDSAKW